MFYLARPAGKLSPLGQGLHGAACGAALRGALLAERTRTRTWTSPTPGALQVNSPVDEAQELSRSPLLLCVTWALGRGLREGSYGGVPGALCACAAVGPLCTPVGCSVGRKRAAFAFSGGSWAVVCVFTCSTCSWASYAQLLSLCCVRFVGPSWELSWGKRAFAREGCLVLVMGCGSPRCRHQVDTTQGSPQQAHAPLWQKVACKAAGSANACAQSNCASPQPCSARQEPAGHVKPKPFAAGGLGTRGDVGTQRGTGATVATWAQRAPCALQDMGVVRGNRTPHCGREGCLQLAGESAPLCNENNPGGPVGACPHMALRGFHGLHLQNEQGRGGVNLTVCGGCGVDGRDAVLLRGVCPANSPFPSTGFGVNSLGWDGLSAGGVQGNEERAPH